MSHSFITTVSQLLSRYCAGKLSRYVIAAILARTSTGASAVAIILLSRSYGADGTTTGVFAACLTAPHIFGPVYGKWLEKAKNPYLLISFACLLFCIAFQISILSFQWQQTELTVLSLLLCGICSSFLMGGLSTQVVKLVDDDLTIRRRAQSWDSITYGIGLTVGPMFISILTLLLSTQITLSLIMALPLLSALILLTLPSQMVSPDKTNKTIPTTKQIISIIRGSASLKRTFLMTAGAAFSFAALPVLAVYFSELWLNNQESGALLVTLYGIGCLVGAASLIFKPLRLDAQVLLRNVGLLLVGCLVLLSLSPSFNIALTLYCLCGIVNSVFFAVTIMARTEYSPAKGAAQIYMWVAAAKITAASLGAVVAGVFVDYFISLPLFISASVLASTILLCFWNMKYKKRL